MQRLFILSLLLLVSTVSCSKSDSKDYVYLSQNSWPAIQKGVADDKLSANNTLIILDDDNTLLQADGYIGSPEWFSDQHSAICDKKLGVGKIVEDCKTFLALNNFVLSVVPKKLTDNAIPGIIKQWQAKGYTVMIVTSRTPSVRFSTLRGLAVHGIYINNDLYAGSTDANAPTGNHVLFLDKDHKHAYMHGVLFTTGYDKATLVAKLFATVKPVKDFTHYIVVDDTQKNLDDFKHWFDQQHKVEGLYSYLYNNEPVYDKIEKSKESEINASLVALYHQFGSPDRVY
jgi:hypothetical protein